jgi:2-oxoacid:acceptor oxidoreductase delta subunit (pyruvate/2-ketoisovalerate family)
MFPKVVFLRIPVAKPGSSVVVKTGEWRSVRPVVDKGKCVKCGICQNYCPEGIMGPLGDFPDIDYDFCKGCSLCAIECPVKCIAMEQEKR